MVNPTTFLAGLAKKTYAMHGQALEKVAFIFPSSSAGYQFRRYLGGHLTGPAWAPAQYSLADFMQVLLPKRVAPKLTLLGYLYGAAQAVAGEKASFAAFCNGKGGQLYDLFEELAQYVIPASQLFSPHPKAADLQGLTAAQQKKVLSFWEKAYDDDERPMVQDFLRGWKAWGAIYEDFHKRLKAAGVVYKGLYYQQVYAALLGGDIAVEYTHIIPVGLQPLTPLVINIFGLLAEQCDLSLYYDTDDYYMTSPVQEAGHYLRTYAQDKLLGKHLQGPYGTALQAQRATIQCYPSATEVGQAEQLGVILHRLMKEDNAFRPAHAVVVLADPALLIPVLHHMPKECALMLDMRYPMRHTPLYALLLHVLKFHYHQQQYHTQKKSHTDKFPSPALTQQLAALLAHPYIKLDNTLSTQLAHGYGLDPVAAIAIAGLPRLWRHLLTPPEKKGGVWNYFITFLAMLMDDKKTDPPWMPWEEVTIAKASALCAQLAKRPAADFVALDWPLIDFFAGQMASISLPLHSGTVEGLRITTVSEVALLDFDYVFILSMNEGKFPPIGRTSAIIAPTLREAYGLPTTKAQASLYAYHFYRLLQRTKKAFFFYHEGQSGGGTSALSRYLLQLQYEAKWRVTIEKRKHHLVLPPKKSITVPKDKEILDTLAAFTAKDPPTHPLTPSAVNTYLDCGLRFYFTYIAKLKPPLTPTPLIHPTFFGQVLHQTMEQLYTPYIGKCITKELFPKLKKAVPSVITACFTQLAKQGESSNSLGGKLVVERVLRTLVHQILRVDEQYAPFVIQGLELGGAERLTLRLPLADGRQVCIGGMIDRVDHKQGTSRVIDYKSSSFRAKVGELSTLFDRHRTNRNTTALQIVWYSWLYQQTQASDGDKVAPTIMSTRNLFDATPKLSLSILNAAGKHVLLDDITPYADFFAQGLKEIVEELFDPEVPFSQTDVHTRCQLCPYKTICQR